MDLLLDLTIFVALIAVTAVCIYVIATLSKVQVVLEDVKTLVRSMHPVISQLEATSTRVIPVLDNAELLLQKLHPMADNLSAMTSVAKDITQKVDKNVDTLLLSVRDAARLSQDIIRLLDEVRRQIIIPMSGIAGLVGAVYKTINAMVGKGKTPEQSTPVKDER